MPERVDDPALSQAVKLIYHRKLDLCTLLRFDLKDSHFLAGHHLAFVLINLRHLFTLNVWISSTLEAARGKGVGRALINAVYKQAKVRSANRVYWLTQNTNTVAMELYDKVAEKSDFVVYRKAL